LKSRGIIHSADALHLKLELRGGNGSAGAAELSQQKAPKSSK
jgi:hypothetical protein